jgi:hypothetical protein
VHDKQQTIVEDFLRLMNVVGVGIGYKVRAGEQTSELSIAVSVTEKMPISQLPASQLVPPEVDGVTTDVVRTGAIRAVAVNRRGVMRPARPGVSIGHYLSTAGTLGCLVRRGGETLILSNNHVLAELNAAELGDPIYQPGPADGGTPSHQIAELADYVRLRRPGDAPEPEPEGCLTSLTRVFTGDPTPDPVLSGVAPPNQVDAALARPLDPSFVHPAILEIGVPSGVAEPVLGAQVRKSGRTTGLTENTVRQIDVTANVIYGNETLRFVNQVVTGPMSRPGDSGSAILDHENRVVGLLFSGSDYATIFTPISFVLAALDIEIITA